MELPMIYEVQKNEISKEYDIKRVQEGYSISIDGSEPFVVEIEQMNGIYNLLFNGKSFDAGCVQHSDCIEVEVAGERHLVKIYDPRKKALRLTDSSGEGLIKTQMPGRIVEVCVAENELVEKGQVVIIVEAMKMENPLKASKSGVVSSIYVDEGDLVEAKTKLVLIE
jgi:biotin carboxyl carrier protein